MGGRHRRLHALVSTLKDKAALTTLSLLSPPPPTSPSAAHLAVLRATPHHPSDLPPSPSHIAALLFFGRSSRLSAAALVRSLSSRLSSSGDPSVALKSLLALHHLLAHGAFILQDALAAALLPSSGRRNPLNLSSFPLGPSPRSFSLSLLVRWYARVLELLLAARRLSDGPTDDDTAVTSLLDRDLLRDMDLLVGVLEEIRRLPEAAAESLSGNRLVAEVVRMVSADRATAENGILVRVREARERLGGLGFGDSVELVCLLRRLEECRPSDRGERKGGDWLWTEVAEVRERAGEVLVEAEKGRVRRERGFESARIAGRVPGEEGRDVRFGSARWLSG